MPLPTPNEGESQDEFMERCMRAQKGEEKPQDQKVAICLSAFRRAKKAKKVREKASS